MEELTTAVSKFMMKFRPAIPKTPYRLKRHIKGEFSEYFNLLLYLEGIKNFSFHGSTKH